MYIYLLLTRLFNVGKKGQQTNAVRILAAEAFKNNVTKSEIAQMIRYKVYSKTDPWDRIARTDKKYNSI